MRGIAIAGAGALMLGLAGCGVEDALDQADAAAFQRECDKLGIARGTPSFDQCMMQQQDELQREIRQNTAAVQQTEEDRRLERDLKALD